MGSNHSRAVERAASAPAGLRLALATIGLCAVGLATLQLGVVLDNDLRGVSAAAAALPALAGVLYVGAGLVAWGRRPHNRAGPLLAAAGLAWIAWGLRAAGVPALAAIGLLCEALPFAIIVHLVLAFPSGRLEGAAERIVVGAGYLMIPLVHAPMELLGASRDDGIRVLDVVDDASVADVALAVQTAADGAVLAGAAVLVARHVLKGDAGLRRAAAPVSVAGLVTLTVVALLDLLDGAGFTASGDLPVDVLDALGVAIVLILPLAFLAGTMLGGFARAGELQELVRRLDVAPTGEASLAAAVGDALGDPSAELGYWLPSERRYVDASGAPLHLGPRRGVEAVTHSGRRVGAITYDRALLRDAEPVRSVAQVVGLALDHERLAAELRAAHASCGPPGPASRRLPTRSAGGSRAISTTAPSSGSCYSPSRAIACDAARRSPRRSAVRRSSCARASTTPSPTFAGWSRASCRRCLPNAGYGPPPRSSRRARRSRLPSMPTPASSRRPRTSRAPDTS
jgi:hypothetical protein